MSFHGSSKFTIEGGHFTNVEGTQHVNHVRGNLVQYVNREERERTIWDEYTRVLIGNIYIKKNIGSTDVRRYSERHWRSVDARRTMNAARIQGEDRDLEFLHITYSGEDAFEAFHRDFEQFSRVRNVNVAQLFGYTDDQFALPALIFYDALVPVSHIFERNGFSSLLYTYFDYQFGVARTADRNLDLGELWIHPRTGVICTGPYVGYSSETFFITSGLETNPATSDDHHFLSLQTYSDSDTLFSYVIRTLPVRNIIRRISFSNRMYWEDVADEDAISMLSSLPGTIYSRINRAIIARWPGDMREWYYDFRYTEDTPDLMQESRVDMDDGSVRFTVILSDIRHLQNQEFSLRYYLLPGKEWSVFAESWLSQAPSVLSQCGVQEDEYEEYSILDGFWLNFQCRNGHSSRKSSDMSNSELVYLFIRPIPRPSDHEMIWTSWTEGIQYFWSFDSFGHEEISEDVRISLGLPSFTSRIEIGHRWWDRIAYNALRQLQTLNCFDPTTTDFTRFLEVPILKVIGDSARFEEVQESPLQDNKAMGVDAERTTSSRLRSIWRKMTLTKVEQRIRSAFRALLVRLHLRPSNRSMYVCPDQRYVHHA